MKFKKIIAAVAAAAVAVSAMAVSAFAAQDTSSLADGTAYLNINNDQWGDFDADWTNATITGDGTYTVSMTNAGGISLAQFNALEVVNGETAFGRTYVITVDSIKLNGIESKNGSSYTCSADGSAVITRVNLYNEWNNPSEDVSDDGYVDCRSADGDVMSKTARLVDYSDLSDIDSIEVTFTVSGLGTAAASDADTTAEAPAADAATTSSSTGNTAAAAIACVMAVAGLAAVATKKRK